MPPASLLPQPATHKLIETIANELEQADKVLIGAGAGLSAADGFEYGGAWFQEHFGDFAAAYGMTDAYTAGFYPFPDETEKWAYWSRHINHHRYLKEPGSVYQDLLTLVRDKDYFVLTTNVDPVSNAPTSTSSDCSTPRVIMDYGSAPPPATRPPTTITTRWWPWSPSNTTGTSRPNSCPAAPAAAGG